MHNPIEKRKTRCLILLPRQFPVICRIRLQMPKQKECKFSLHPKEWPVNICGILNVWTSFWRFTRTPNREKDDLSHESWLYIYFTWYLSIAIHIHSYFLGGLFRIHCYVVCFFFVRI